MQNIESRIQDLKEFAEKLPMKIEVFDLNDQELSIQSGYCKPNGKDLIILDKNLPDVKHMAIIFDTIKRFNLDNIYIADWIREKIKTTKTDGIQL
jgi:hypothetical protein